MLFCNLAHVCDTIGYLRAVSEYTIYFLYTRWVCKRYFLLWVVGLFFNLKSWVVGSNYFFNGWSWEKVPPSPLLPPPPTTMQLILDQPSVTLTSTLNIVLSICFNMRSPNACYWSLNISYYAFYVWAPEGSFASPWKIDVSKNWSVTLKTRIVCV